MFRKLFILVIIFIISSLAVSAQLDEDANACDEGGSMEGKCNIDFNGDGEVSDYEVTWAWTCGWYMIRYDAGEFSRNQVPVFCSSLLPAEVPAEADGGDEGPLYCWLEPGEPGTYWIYPANPDGTPMSSEPIDTIIGAEPSFPECVTR